MAHEWRIDEGRTEDYWLELVGSVPGDEEKNTWRRVSVKWDGCIHFTVRANSPENLRESGKDAENDCYIHICDIDEMIEDLQQIKRFAQEHFKDHHYDAWKPAPAASSGEATNGR